MGWLSELLNPDPFDYMAKLLRGAIGCYSLSQTWFWQRAIMREWMPVWQSAL